MTMAIENKESVNYRTYFLRHLFGLSIAHIVLGIVIIIIGAVFMASRCYGYQIATPIWGGVVFVLTGGIGCVMYYNNDSKPAVFSFMVLSILSVVVAILIIAHGFIAAPNEVTSSNCDQSLPAYDRNCGSVQLRICMDVAIVMLATMELLLSLLGAWLDHQVSEGTPDLLIPIRDVILAKDHRRSSPRSYQTQYREEPPSSSVNDIPLTSAHDNIAYASTITAEEKHNRRRRRLPSAEKSGEVLAGNSHGSESRDDVCIQQLDHPPRVITPSHNRKHHEMHLERTDATPMHAQYVDSDMSSSPPSPNPRDESNNLQRDDEYRYHDDNHDRRQEPSQTDRTSSNSTPNVSIASTQPSSEKLSHTPRVEKCRYEEVPLEHRYDEVPSEQDNSGVEPKPGHLTSSFSSSGWSSEYFDAELPIHQTAMGDSHREPDTGQGPMYGGGDDQTAPPASYTIPPAEQAKAIYKPYHGPDEREKFSEGSIRKSLERLYGTPLEATLFVVNDLKVEHQGSSVSSDEDLYRPSPQKAQTDELQRDEPQSDQQPDTSIDTSVSYTDDENSSDTIHASQNNVHPQTHSQQTNDDHRKEETQTQLPSDDQGHAEEIEPAVPAWQTAYSYNEPHVQDQSIGYREYPQRGDHGTSYRDHPQDHDLGHRDYPRVDRDYPRVEEQYTGHEDYPVDQNDAYRYRDYQEDPNTRYDDYLSTPPQQDNYTDYSTSRSRSPDEVEYPHSTHSDEFSPRRPWKSSKDSVYSAPEARSTRPKPSHPDIDLQRFASERSMRERMYATDPSSRPPARASEYYGIMYQSKRV